MCSYVQNKRRDFFCFQMDVVIISQQTALVKACRYTAKYLELFYHDERTSKSKHPLKSVTMQMPVTALAFHAK